MGLLQRQQHMSLQNARRQTCLHMHDKLSMLRSLPNFAAAQYAAALLSCLSCPTARLAHPAKRQQLLAPMGPHGAPWGTHGGPMGPMGAPMGAPWGLPYSPSWGPIGCGVARRAYYAGIACFGLTRNLWLAAHNGHCCIMLSLRLCRE